jgi:hypothetical protein
MTYAQAQQIIELLQSINALLIIILGTIVAAIFILAGNH